MDAIQTIQDDIACPQCEYNLRGLLGDIVQCPECGVTCDRAEIVARGWTRPWHKAPGMTPLSFPVAWLYVGFIGMIIWFNSVAQVSPMMRLAAWSLLVVGWILLMARAWYVFERGEALALALFSHVVLAAYLAAFIMVPILMLTILFFERGSVALLGIRLSTGAWLIVLPIAAVIGFLVGRIGQRFIAHRCIRQYLRRKPAS